MISKISYYIYKVLNFYVVEAILETRHVITANVLLTNRGITDQNRISLSYVCGLSPPGTSMQMFDPLSKIWSTLVYNVMIT